MKRLATAALLAFLAAAAAVPPAHACTNFLISKGASADGSTMITYSADSHDLYGELYHWPAAKHPPGAMRDVVEWDTGKLLGRIPEAPETYAVVGNMNERQVAVGETTWGGRSELAKSEEDVLTYAMFPEIGRQFLEQRAAGTLKPEPLEPPTSKESASEAAPTEFNLVLHGESFHVKVTGTGHKEQAERHFYLTVDGVPEEVVVQTLDQLVLTGGAQGAVQATIGGKRPKATKEGQVSTSMPGNIVAVLVKEGDLVTAGQPVLVTEAMKMETEVQAPIAGKVTGVYVAKGDSVTPGEALLEIEAA